MTDQTLNVGPVYARQVKESSYEQGPSGAYDQLIELPGFLELCVDVNGVPWVLARRKAPGLLADIKRAELAAAASAPPPPAPAPAPDQV